MKTYKLTAVFQSADRQRIARKVTTGLSWEDGMDQKDALLNVPQCVAAYLEPQGDAR